MNAEDLKRFSLLAELLDEDREALLELLEPEKIRQGRSVYRETAEADAMLLIVSGTVQLVSKRSENLGTLGAGAVLGSASLLAMGQREATVKAQSECEVWVLPRTAYRRLVDDYPRTACRLTEAIAAEIAGLLREGLDVLLPGPEGS